MATKTPATTRPKLVAQLLVSLYDDGTTKITEVDLSRRPVNPPRDARGKFTRTAEKITAVSPDEMVTCPACGARFRVGKKA